MKRVDGSYQFPEMRGDWIDQKQNMRWRETGRIRKYLRYEGNLNRSVNTPEVTEGRLGQNRPM